MSNLEQKYRPKTFDDLIFSSAKQKMRFSSYVYRVDSPPSPTLLLGDPGNGKSTMAHLLAELYTENGFYIEKVSGIKPSPASEFASLENRLAGQPSSFISNKAVVIVDEIDELRECSQNVLRGIIDRQKDRWWFILTANGKDAIEARLMDRVLTEPIIIKREDIKARLEAIMLAEQLVLADDVIDSILNLSRNSLRKAIMMLGAKIASLQQQPPQQI